MPWDSLSLPLKLSLPATLLISHILWGLAAPKRFG